MCHGLRKGLCQGSECLPILSLVPMSSFCRRRSWSPEGRHGLLKDTGKVPDKAREEAWASLPLRVLSPQGTRQIASRVPPSHHALAPDSLKTPLSKSTSSNLVFRGC